MPVQWHGTLTPRQKIALSALALLYLSSWALSIAGTFDTIWFLDIPYHYLGGFFTGLFFIDVFKDALTAERTLWHELAVIVGITLIVGFLWELYEYILTVTVGDYFIARGITCCIGDTFDTLKDLLMDSLGAFTMFFIVRYHNRSSAMFR